MCIEHVELLKATGTRQAVYAKGCHTMFQQSRPRLPTVPFFLQQQPKQVFIKGFEDLWLATMGTNTRWQVHVRKSLFPRPPMIACIPSRRLSTSSIATAATSSLKRGHQLCNGLSAASRSGHGRVMVASRVGPWSETSGRVGSCVKLKEPSFN